MSKGEIATFIVCWIEGFICYLIGYTIGITHDKRTITHECIKDTHDDPEPQTEHGFSAKAMCSTELKEWIARHIEDEPQKWETPPKFEHKGIITTCVGVPASLLEIEDGPRTERGE